MMQLKSLIPPANERKKLGPLGLMFFCILFNYTILRDTKDVLMVTAPKSGAEVIPFIKTYVNLPAAIGFTGLYANMVDSMDHKNVFYALVVPFLAFFSLFSLVIYPNRAFLHPHGLVDSLAALLPAGFSAPLAIIRNWSFALFYVMAEMWGSVVTSLLFWGFANEVTTVDEAKKYCECLNEIKMCLHFVRDIISSVVAPGSDPSPPSASLLSNTTHFLHLNSNQTHYLGWVPMLLLSSLDNMYAGCLKCEPI